MKSSYHGPAPPLFRSKAWICAAINVFAFPGLGTIMARASFGYTQAGLMVLGFLLLTGYMIIFFTAMLQYTMLVISKTQMHTTCWRYAWIGFWGVSLTLVAWIWALVSSIQIVRRSVPAPSTPALSGARPSTAAAVPNESCKETLNPS